ncbi:MAG: MGMT family protein [Candidatus Daviesbacteria bacterium]|nr:MGMT family protein [Candidatus Daviesbacteria bacterium]
MAKGPTGFKQRVIQIIKQVPFGKVTTYGTISTFAGLPRGARLVGGILHFNTEALDLPWHRIINRHGFISTNCLEHPKQAQKALLLSEGIEVSDDFIVDLKQYGWWGEIND